MSAAVKANKGFGKKRAPTDAQIRRHREQVHTSRQWRDDLSRIRGITQNLGHTYANHKGDFALGRYEELKQMIKGAIKEYHELMEKSQKTGKTDAAAAAMASKYSGKPGDAQPNNNNSGGGGGGGSPGGVGGFLSKIKKRAADFASSSTSVSSSGSSSRPDKDKEMETWGYEGRSAKDIEEETESLRKEVMQMKQDFRVHRDKLEHLAKEYEDSKKHTPPQRYTVLKFMIKDTVAP